MPTQEIYNQQLYGSTPVNGALGGLAVAEKNQEYFIVFKQAGGTGPEIIGETAYFISYLVKADGTVNKPSEDYDSLYNLIQNFEVGKDVIVRQDTATALNTQLAGKHTITAIGRQQPILYSQTGSFVGSYTSSIFFKEGNLPTNDTSIGEFRGTMQKSVSTSIGTSFSQVNGFTSILNPPPVSASFTLSPSSTYSITSLDAIGLQSITFNITTKLTNPTPFPQNVSIRLRRVQDGNYTYLATKTYTILPASDLITGGDPLTYTDLNTDLAFIDDPSWTIQISGTNSLLTAEWFNFSVLSQNPQPGTTSIPISQIPFWQTGSDSYITWLTASEYLSINYNKTQNLDGFSLDTGFNFSPIIEPFTLNIGDRIRFGYNKTNDYYIYDIIQPDEDSEGLLKLKLNSPLPSDIELNNFLIHRTDINDPAYIILDVDKDETVGDTQNFNGVILPEYPTQELKDNLDSIILDLKEKGIITDNEN